MLKCDKVEDINELWGFIDANQQYKTGDNMQSNGIKFNIKKEDSDYVCYAKKDGVTKHFYEDTDLDSVKHTVATEIEKGVDWNSIEPTEPTKLNYEDHFDAFWNNDKS